MSTGGIIAVTVGIHAGASVLLSDGHDLTIGSAEAANLVLVDNGIAPHHATVRLSGNVLKLTALHDGVSVFGYPLAPGKATVLTRGASFTVGDAQLQFSGRDLLTPDAVRHAELAWLLAHAPLAYVAKRWALASRGTKLTLLLLMMSAGAGAIYGIYGPHDVERKPPRLEGAFRFVTVHEDPKTHAYVYEGYVPGSPDLASLIANARRDTRAPVIRVIAVDQLKEQLADFLQKYYRDARIEPGAPGSFTIVPPAEDAYVLPESWDYGRVARLARESIIGLRDIRFAGHVVDNGPVRAPLEAIGMNLGRSAHGTWLVDSKGVRYFSGAQLQLGRITSISRCTVTIMRNDDGTAYEFSAKGGKVSGKCS
ncbi:hypothetical protein GCT13_07195 [Paraburkholderia sp. CNPSo 3157]|uniref:YscD cytoplasmic domain-containing protein n=1 Tax=Paraburkholderia franconis TaxID=2654983 RepID=A0A7X1N815_9BURK|nr:FHA domain-containing protein [Paraburkholderia franconis]MPW16726.1 hypothetical protein [Paraburkholderia franconis]